MVFDVRQKFNVAAALVNKTSGAARKNVADVTFRIINDPVHLDDRHSISLNYDGEDFFDSLATVIHLAVSEAPEDDIDILGIVGKDGGAVNFDTDNFNDKFMEVYESTFQKEFSLSLVDEYTLELVNDKTMLDMVSTEIRDNIAGKHEYDEKTKSKSPMVDIKGELDMDRLIKSNKDWRFKMPFYARKRMSVDIGNHEEAVNEVGICDEFNQLKQYGFRKRCSRHHLRNIIRFIKENTKDDNFIVGKNDVDIKAMKILQYYIGNSNAGYHGLDECVGIDVFLDYLRLSGGAVVKDKIATKAAAEVVAGGIRLVHGYENRLLILNAALHTDEDINLCDRLTEEVGMVVDVLRKDTNEQSTHYENLSIDVLKLSYNGDIAVDSLRALFRLTNGALIFDYASPTLKNSSAFHHIIKTLSSKGTTVDYMVSTINENFGKYNTPTRMGVLAALIEADPEMNCQEVNVRELNTYINMEKSHRLDLELFEGSHVNAKWFSAVIRLCDYAVQHNYPILNMSNDSFSKLTDRISSRDCKGIDDKYIRIIAKVMSNRNEDDGKFGDGLRMIFTKGISDRLDDILNPSLFGDFMVRNHRHVLRWNPEARLACRLFEQYNRQDWHCIDTLVGSDIDLVDEVFDKVYDNGTICPTVLQTAPNMVSRYPINTAACLKVFKNCKEARSMVFFPDWFIKEHAKELFDAVTNDKYLTMQNKAVGYIRIMNAIGLNAIEELGRLPVAEIIECDTYHIFAENANNEMSVIVSPTLDFYERYLDIALMDKEHELNVGLNLGYHTAFFVKDHVVANIIDRILDTGIFDTETKAKTIYMMIAGFEACVKIEHKLHGLTKGIKHTQFAAMRKKIARVCFNTGKPAEEGLWASRLHVKFLQEGLID